jgi:hypothetical protein
MRDTLLDLVEHTHDLGCIDLVKITGTDALTSIEGMAEDRSVVVQGTTNAPVTEFVGTFGMPNLSKLKVILGIPEYKKDATITVEEADREGTMTPVGMHFANEKGDFKNDYRFMTSSVVGEKLKTLKFKGANWHLEFTPTAAAIQRLKFQANANAEETTFTTKTSGTDLVLSFGDHSTHAGNFVFHTNCVGKLSREWAYPIKQIIAILDLNGDKVMKISDDGAAQITVTSGLATYNYIIPAQSK